MFVFIRCLTVGSESYKCNTILIINYELTERMYFIFEKVI